VRGCGGILGLRADIMTRNSLHPRLKNRIEESAVFVF
jgi:predicted nucleotidyltransferase